MRRLFRLARVFCTMLGLSLLLITLTPVMPWAAGKMPVDWYQGDADVLVVLGGSMLVDGTGPQAAMGWDSYLRCSYALWNLQRYHYGYVVVSGPDGLGEAMAKYLVAHGIRSEQVLVENAARSTLENAVFVKIILTRQPGLPAKARLAILTSDYHSRRAGRVFARQGMVVRVVPVPDAGKRAAFWGMRWDVFLDLSEELLKFGVYRIRGWI